MRFGVHWTIAATMACIACSGSPQRSSPPEVPTAEASGVAPSPPAEASSSDRWLAKLSFDGARWHVDYRFPEPQVAVIFDSVHGLTYRTAQWKVAGNGSVEHLSGLDALLFSQPASRATIDIEPPSSAPDGPLAFVAFSDGSHAFWTGQLGLLTAKSRSDIADLGGNLRKWRGMQPPIAVEIDSKSPLLGPSGVGTHFESTAHEGHGAYYYTGTSEDPMLVVDPGLPGWVNQAFRTKMPEIKRKLDVLWAHPLPAPQLMLAWGGGEGDWSNRGRAEGRQIVMRIRGAAYVERNPTLLGDLVWFFAHEMTHLQQFEEGGEGETWMIEGFADTLATEALVAIGLWDQKDLERRYWSVARECARELSRGPLDGARGRVSYVCGDLVGVALLKALPDGSMQGLWKKARVGRDRVDRERLLESARELGAADAALTAVDAFVREKHADTDRAIRALLTAAGLEPKYVKGSLSSMSFPFRVIDGR